MPKPTPRSLTALLIVFAGAIPLSAVIDNPVKLDSGMVSGINGTHPDVRVFKGLPFAEPPVGNLRWRAPKPRRALERRPQSRRIRSDLYAGRRPRRRSSRK